MPTVCALGVLVNPDLSVKCAGGFLVQLLPFCPEGVIDQVEETVAALPSVTAMLESGMTPRIMMDKLLAGFAYDILDEYEPVYRCNCSRERVERAFSAMRPEELLSLPDENGRVEATCSFCDKTYHFTIADLEKMVASREEAE